MKKAAPAVAAARAPWIHDGIDYGPARAAIRDLATWALNIAERSVADWPVGRNHVRRTRRFLESRIDGKRVRCVSIEDVMFTASLLARIFEADLDLDLSDALTIFDVLELPLDVMPVAPRPARASTHHALPRSGPLAPITPIRRPAIPPLRYCDDCGTFHEPGEHFGYRNAA